MKMTYVDWPESLFHIVGGENVGNTSELVQHAIFKSKHRRRSHDGGLREYTSDYFLTPGLMGID